MNQPEVGAYSVGLVLGILLGAFTCALGFIVLAAWVGRVGSANFVQQYQDLIGSIITLIGALFAVGVVLKQIRHAEADAAQERAHAKMLSDREQQQVFDLAAEALDRRSSAARTLMPGALAAVNGYAENCLQIMDSMRVQHSAPADPCAFAPAMVLAPFPSPPRDAILDLRDCVEPAPADVQEAILDLVVTVQIQNSRLLSLYRSVSGQRFSPFVQIGPQEIARRIVEALDVYARSSALYDYARRRTEHAERDLDFVSAAFNNDMDDSNYPEVHRLIESNYRTIDYKPV